MANALQEFMKQAREVAAPIVDQMRAISNSHHSAALHAFIRQGADEIAQILPAFPESVKTAGEIGQLFEPTMQEVFLQKTGRELDIDMGR